MSLRARVAALVIAAFTIVLLVIGFLVPALVRDFLLEQLDRQLDEARIVAIGVLNDELGGVDRYPDFGRGGPTATYAGAYVEYRDAAGVLVVGRFVDDEIAAELSAPDLPDVLLLADGTATTFPSISGDDPEEWRVLQFPVRSAPDGEEAGVATVALPTTPIEETVNRVVRIQWVAGGVGIVVLGGAAWLLIGVGLKPLRRMERTAAAITDAGDLGQRVDHPGERTELGRLGVTLNAMLGRLQGSFVAQQVTEGKLRRFVADASHELRTPLTSIRGYAELYRRGGDQPEQVGRSMERIEDEALRMGRLVDDLLTLARLDERTDVERSDIDMASLVADLVDDIRVVDAERTYTLLADERCTVSGDDHRLSQAVANLLANARTHTAPGTVVDVTVRRAGSRVRVAVADHGAGLADGEAAIVFDRFYRADPSRSRQAGGAGLGLAITAAIVAAHDGTVTAGPTPGGGATFTIDLPATP